MALVANRNEIKIKSITRSVHCANVPRAKLMFYLDCVCSVLELDDPDIHRLKDYDNYLRLNAEEEGKLLILCLLFSPDVLIGKCFFPDEDGDMCEGRLNGFYEISAVQNRVVVTENILIGNHQRHVNKIMFYKMAFIEEYFFAPIRTLKSSLEATQRSSSSALTYSQRSNVVTPSPGYNSDSRTHFKDMICLNIALCIAFPPWIIIWAWMCICCGD